MLPDAWHMLVARTEATNAVAAFFSPLAEALSFDSYQYQTGERGEDVTLNSNVGKTSRTS